MSDTSGVNLKEPDQMDWENYNPGSKFTPPPPAKGSDGKYINYFVQAPLNVGDPSTLEVTDEGYRQFVVDPLKIVKSGSADGYELRFARVNVKKFAGKDGKPTNASSAGNYIRCFGVTAKPQKNNEYESAVKVTRGKVGTVTIDWTAYNKDTGERIDGYDNFPADPDRPGMRKVILKKGDTYTVVDRQTKAVTTETVKAEVMFANARVKYWQDPSKKQSQ